MSTAIALAIMFPSSMGMEGAMTTIGHLPAFYRSGRSYPSKYSAVRAITQANLDRAIARGRGNRSKRLQMELDAVWASRSMTVEQVDEFARSYEAKHRSIGTCHEL